MRILLLLLLTSFPLFARITTTNALEETRIALMDLRQAYREQKVELEILQEQVEKLRNSPKGASKDIELRIAKLEKTQERMSTDLHQLSGNFTQIQQSLTLVDKQLEDQNKRLNEVVKLKSTLNSISKAIGSSGKIHKVHAGDSLEKIARQYNTTIEDLKKANGLSSNTIIIGQELKIP